MQPLSNEALWALLLCANFLSIVLVYRIGGRSGLYVWIAIATIVANVQVTKTVEVFGLTATLGNIVYAGSFLATDMLNEFFGERSARRGVLYGFVAVAATILLMNGALFFTPDPTDFAHPHLTAIFGLLPRIGAASVIAYLVSQRHDVWAYQFWKRRFPARLWLRNNISTLVSQLIDTVLFTSIAFVGVFPVSVLLEILLTTYLFKGVVAILDTPFLYLAKRITPPDEV